MASPTGLTVRTSLQSMDIGDCIICKYVATSGAVGTFSELGTSVASEISIAGGSATPNGTFYFIKVAKGLLIADRNIQTTIPWDTLNSGKFIEGKVVTLGSDNVLIRSISGGVGYADSNGNLSTTDQSLGGYPTNNEWDKYIRLSTLGGKITAGSNSIWNWGYRCFTREIPAVTISANTNRNSRGISLTMFSIASSTSGYGSGYGWRPVLEYVDNSLPSYKKPTTLFY